MKFKVIYNYEARRPDELSIRIGDIIENVTIKSGGWAVGHVRGRSGLFPLNHTSSLPRSRESESYNETYRAIYPYSTSNDEELELREGSIIELLSKDDSGWWYGRCEGKEGIFPSNFVIGPLVNNILPETIIEEDSPVVMRRSSNSNRNSQVMSFHASIDQNIGSPGMFSPEDEPPEHMFGSLTSQFDWSTASLSSFSFNASHGTSFFRRMKQSLSTKSLFPKFLSGRLSSNSLNDKSSIGSSSFRRRRNSLASFFHKSPSIKSNLSENVSHLPGLRPISSTPKIKSEENFRKTSSSSEKKSSRNTEQSMSWVFEESSIGVTNSIVDHKTPQRRRNLEDSGISPDIVDSPDDIFGPIVELNDEVFDEMFETVGSKNDQMMRFNNSLFEKKTNEKKRLSLSMIKTSFSPIEKRFSLGASRRSQIKTNPTVTWKPDEEQHSKKRIQVTEL